MKSCFPSDEELISHCLYNKVHNKPNIIPCNCTVKEFDLYSEEPWEIWKKNGGLELERKNSKGFLYLFTKLKRKTAKSKRFDRRVVGSNGGGWEGEDSAKKITTDHCVGFKKRFRYENPNNSEQHGRWIMFEFNLEQPKDFVLCCIKKNVNTKTGRKRRREDLIKPQQPLDCEEEEDTAPAIDPIIESPPLTISDQDYLLQNQPLTISTPSADKWDDHVVYSDAIMEFAQELLMQSRSSIFSGQESEFEMLANENCNNHMGWERLYCFL